MSDIYYCSNSQVSVEAANSLLGKLWKLFRKEKEKQLAKMLLIALSFSFASIWICMLSQERFAIIFPSLRQALTCQLMQHQNKMYNINIHKDIYTLYTFPSILQLQFICCHNQYSSINQTRIGSTFFDNLLQKQVKDFCQFSKSSNLDLLQECSLANGGFSCVILGFFLLLLPLLLYSHTHSTRRPWNVCLS